MRRKNKAPLGWFSRLVLLFNFVLAACILASYFSPSTDPRNFWPVAFLGLAYPVMLPVNGILLIYWLLVRPGYALLPLLTLALGWTILTGTVGFRMPESDSFLKPAAPSIRLLTYNVHYFRKFDDDGNGILTKEFMLSIMAKEKPDIICLQELMTHRSGEFDNISSVKKITGLNYIYFVPDLDNSYEAHGLAIFSRFPIVNSGSILFPHTNRGNEAMFADIMANGKKIRIYNVHFQSIGFQPEDYKYLEEVKGIHTDDMKSTRRIGARLKRAFLLRSGQVQLLKAHTLTCGLPFLLAGDFNDTPGSFAVNTMAAGLKNAFREKGSGFGITYNGEFPNFQIDYILASPGFRVGSYHIINKKLSDHYAVRSDLALK